MEWESESSDDEESTGQRFRRKEPAPAVVRHAPPAARATIDTVPPREPDAETIADSAHPSATPTSSASDVSMAMSPTTFDLLLGQIAPEMENLRWESTTDWDLHGPNHPQPEETASNDGHSDSDDVPTPGRERYPLPDGWTCNSTDGRVPAVVWQTICARQPSARMSRQRFRVATDEGSYQVTMKPTGAGAVSFLPRK
ncbi:hypothetical protein M5D96_013767 [Drosophila gunungcola]|uniref:Uncharacterized protein n=1 Tax=Drosophila gunungcola TaxID=103775 RepID=A0A9Q0BJ93_9MUSC|nr:hypothetical protein M5D96_013767 [Drosophila gunungcola]